MGHIQHDNCFFEENEKLRRELANYAERCVRAETALLDLKTELERGKKQFYLRSSFVDFRVALRNVLARHGVCSNPGFTEDCIVTAFEEKLKSLESEVELARANAAGSLKED